MTPAGRLAAFTGALAALFAVSAAAGSALQPDPPGSAPGASHGAPSSGDEATHDAAAPTAVRGLAVAQDGLRLEVERPARPVGVTAPLALRIVDDGGQPVRRLDLTHERLMHVIVVRRDLTGFQHLHPELGQDGRWTTPLRLASAGSYRVFADFSYRGRATTLASDLRVSGPAALRSLPAPSGRAVSDRGLTVTRHASANPPAAAATTLSFTASRGGAPVTLQPYLGAGGHLVALREGDLAFLHVHPTHEAASDRRAGRVSFATTFPTPGRYRLFLQLQVDGQVHTTAFTQEVPAS